MFGFTAALAERIPIIGLIFSVSNRIGAAMWAHGMYLARIPVHSDKLTGPSSPDLEKRQHYVAALKGGVGHGNPSSPKPKTE